MVSVSMALSDSLPGFQGHSIFLNTSKKVQDVAEP